MKKVSMCMGFFMVFFLIICVYTAQADVTGLNGTWLKFTGKVKGMVFSGGLGSSEEGRNDKDSVKLYGCIVDGPFFDNQFYIQLYEKERAATPAGHAVFQKSAGTGDDFAGWLSMKLMENYNPLNPDVYTTSVSAPGEIKIKRDKLEFEGFGGQAEKEPAGTYTGYALYGVNKLKAKTSSSRSLPFDENTPCPAGNLIQVKKTDNGFGIGTITPAGPWVPVASNVVQQVTITTSIIFPCTTFNVYVDGITTTPFNPYSDCARLPFSFNLTPGLNHSVWVEFFYPF